MYKYKTVGGGGLNTYVTGCVCVNIFVKSYYVLFGVHRQSIKAVCVYVIQIATWHLSK